MTDHLEPTVLDWQRIATEFASQISCLQSDNARLLAVVQAAQALSDGYPQARLHRERTIIARAQDEGQDKCDWCGRPWPCPTATLVAALAAVDGATSDE